MGRFNQDGSAFDLIAQDVTATQWHWGEDDAGSQVSRGDSELPVINPSRQHLPAAHLRCISSLPLRFCARLLLADAADLDLWQPTLLHMRAYESSLSKPSLEQQV